MANGRVLAVLAMLIGTLLSACGTTRSGEASSTSGGPLQASADGSEVCGRANGTHPATIGYDVLVNSSAEDLRLTDVRILGGINLLLAGGALIPTSVPVPGTSLAYPPTGSQAAMTTREWAERLRAGSLVPGHGRSYFLVLGVRLGDSGAYGSADGAEVVYTYEGRTYTTRTSTRLHLVAGPVCVPGGA